MGSERRRGRTRRASQAVAAGRGSSPTSRVGPPHLTASLSSSLSANLKQFERNPSSGGPTAPLPLCVPSRAGPRACSCFRRVPARPSRSRRRFPLDNLSARHSRHPARHLEANATPATISQPHRASSCIVPSILSPPLRTSSTAASASPEHRSLAIAQTTVQASL